MISISSAQISPKEFVAKKVGALVAIDECLLERRLYPALKEWVRTHPKPGQFVLSGSVCFTSRKAIKESLAGRISTIEMLPFSISEILEEDLPECFIHLLKHRIKLY